MWAKRIEDLIAFQLANEFKREVYRLVGASPGARTDFKFKDQITHAAAGIERTLNEGYHRRLNTEFAQYIRYALGSLGETKGHLKDGIDRGHLVEADCHEAFKLARRCEDVTTRLLSKIQRSIEQDRKRQHPRRAPRSDDRI